MKRTRKIHFLTCAALGMGAGSLSLQAIAISRVSFGGSIAFGLMAFFVIYACILNVKCAYDISDNTKN